MPLIIDTDKVIIDYGEDKTPCFLFPCLTYSAAGTTVTNVTVIDSTGKKVHLNPESCGYESAEALLAVLKEANEKLCGNTAPGDDGGTEPTIPVKTYIGSRWFYPTSEEDLDDCDKTLICYDAWVTSTGEWCYYPAGADAIDSNLITNINEFTMAKQQPKLGTQSVKDILCLCVTIDRTAVGADATITGTELLANAIAQLTAKGITAPAGTTFGLQTITPYSFGMNSAVTDFVTQVESMTSIDEELDNTCAGAVQNVNPGGAVTYGQDVYDMNKDGVSDYLLDPAAFESLITDGSAGRYHVCMTANKEAAK